jgi:PAS domain S-box-containing protein
LAIASLPGTFCLFDRYGKILRWNFNLEAVSGYSSDEIKEMTPSDFFMEEARPSVQEAIQRVLKEGASNVEGEMLSKDGRRRHYFFSGRIILATGADSAHGVTSAADMGVQAIMKKLFDVFLLLDNLRKVLQTPLC